MSNTPQWNLPKKRVIFKEVDFNQSIQRHKQLHSLFKSDKWYDVYIEGGEGFFEKRPIASFKDKQQAEMYTNNLNGKKL